MPKARKTFLNRQLGMKVYTKLVKFVISKNLRVKSTMFPHRNIYKYTWTSQDGKPTIRLTIFRISEGIRLYLMFDHSRQQIVILTTLWPWQI
jgi:hypothetical protein